MSVNYQRLFEETLRTLSPLQVAPRLLLHACCAPCSTAVLETLGQHFQITLLYYNPNIFPETEYIKRGEELQKLVSACALHYPIDIVAADYQPEAFELQAAGLEDEPEGGRRCLKCFALRLEETAQRALDGGYDYFTTTLSVSPHKNAEAINNIGGALAEKYGVKYLFADFKKKEGYKRSITLSQVFGLYRQDYCGCRLSLDARRAIPPK